MIVLGMVVRSFYSLSTRGRSVSSIETSVLTEYIRFLLHGATATTKGFRIPIAALTAWRSFLVAVAVNAITWTPGGIMLLISPMRPKAI